jgi:PAS domain S-box-containing protein/putative nucleotidyltransferase with HDIG domain
MIKRKSTSRKAPAARKTPRKAARKTAASGKARSLPAAQESEVRYLHLFESANDALFVGDAETGLLLDANRKACELVGRTRKELVGRPQSALHPPEDAEHYRAVFHDHVLKGDATTGNLVLAHASGRRIPVEISASVMDFGGRQAVLGIFRDISARSRMEQALRESEEQFRNLADQSPNMILITQEGRVVYANAQCAKIMGYAREEFTAPGFDFMVLIVPEYREMIRENLERHYRGLDVEPLEYALLTVDGRRLEAIINTRMIRHRGESAILCVVTDITERKRMEEDLRESEERFRIVAEETGQLIYDYDSDTGRIVWSGAVQDVVGDTPEEFQSVDIRVWEERIHPEDRAAALALLKQAQMRFSNFDAVYRFRHQNGSYIHVHDRGVFVRDPDGRVIRMLGAMGDISDRHRAEEELRASEERWHTLVKNAPNIIFSVDRALLITFINRVQTELSMDQILGSSPMDYVLPEHQKSLQRALQRVLKTGVSETVEIRGLGPNQTDTWYSSNIGALHVKGEITGLIVVASDMTERHRAEKELGRSYERMRQTIRGTIHTISKIVESRDPFTAGHQLRVAELALEIARLMDLDLERRQGIHTAALIHDIGKIHVPAEILSKPGRLTEIEFEMIRTHSQFGFKILENIDFPWPVADIVLQHHERLDGSGYPNRLHREAILLDARIISVADVVEAMAMHRPYRPALGLDRALDEIREHRGVLYDTGVVEACLTLFFEKGFQFSMSTEPRDFSIV